MVFYCMGTGARVLVCVRERGPSRRGVGLGLLPSAFVRLQNWCHIATDKMRVANLLVDPHAPPRVRVNAAMGNFQPFAKAFCCRNGTVMNNDPAQQCPLLW